MTGVREGQPAGHTHLGRTGQNPSSSSLAQPIGWALHEGGGGTRRLSIQHDRGEGRPAGGAHAPWTDRPKPFFFVTCPTYRLGFARRRRWDEEAFDPA